MALWVCILEQRRREKENEGKKTCSGSCTNFASQFEGPFKALVEAFHSSLLIGYKRKLHDSTQSKVLLDDTLLSVVFCYVKPVQVMIFVCFLNCFLNKAGHHRGLTGLPD